MDYALALQWMALALLFLISSIWSERNVRFGYIITPLMGGFFWAIGWIQFQYLTTLIPMIIMIGVLAYLRTHLRVKFGVFGSSGGLLFKIVVFLIFLQFAIIFVNGLVSIGVFQDQFGPTPSNELTTYTIEHAQTVYGTSTTGVSLTDAVWNGLGLIWSNWQMFWKLVFGFFSIYGTMVTFFHMPPSISLILSMGIYVMTAIEIFVLIFKPFRAPEV